MTHGKTRHVVVIHGDLNRPFPTYPHQDWQSNDNGVMARLHTALAELEGYRFRFLSNHDTLLADLQDVANEIDLVLQLCDDGYRNDPNLAVHICAFLDLLGLRYTGSGVKAMALTGDKQIQLDIAQRNGIPVPASRLVQPWEPLPVDVQFPAFVKPSATDGSLGITRKSVVHSTEELAQAVRMIRQEFRLTCPILIQKFLPGRDLWVSILGNPPDDFLVLPITEEDYTALPQDYPHICGYEAKWDPTSPYWQLTTCRTTLATDQQAFVVACCKRLYTRLEMRDYARFDWRLDAHGAPYFLEANANCAWCWDGHLAKAATLAGLSYSGLFATILDCAWRRYGN